MAIHFHTQAEALAHIQATETTSLNKATRILVKRICDGEITISPLNTAQRIRAEWADAPSVTAPSLSDLMDAAEFQCERHIRMNEIDADQYMFDDWSVLAIVADKVAVFAKAGDAQDWVSRVNVVDPKPAAPVTCTTSPANDKLLNALRELVRAHQAVTQAQSDLVDALPDSLADDADVQHSAFELAEKLSEHGDWRNVSAVEMAKLLNIIEGN